MESCYFFGSFLGGYVLVDQHIQYINRTTAAARINWYQDQ